MSVIQDFVFQAGIRNAKNDVSGQPPILLRVGFWALLGAATVVALVGFVSLYVGGTASDQQAAWLLITGYGVLSLASIRYLTKMYSVMKPVRDNKKAAKLAARAAEQDAINRVLAAQPA